ncbi:hypothetical protein IVA94_38375 [Bradyrhizobium sp. 156]|uniref:hypothetical protein n=1 Tax=Bradyrhizobium sp. 156 TaxID=2782630 RepID=UPI001FF85044|nr:hypothetical protein [Bradyrhizobium sp. 156]MCK1326559.1 hypothetical protein [Bradyrhizobium sp. 156]
MTIFGDDRSGLTINARIAARTPAEHRAQEGLGTRCLPWDELDAPVRSLAWWTEVVGEVTLAVRNAPPVPRPSRSEDDLELAAFDDLFDQLDRTITQSALAVLGTHPAKHVSRELGSEAAMLAALKFAALAAYTGQVGLTDAQDELRMAMGEVMPRLSLVCTTYAKVLCLRVGRLRGRSLTQPPRRSRIQARSTRQFRRSAHLAHHLPGLDKRRLQGISSRRRFYSMSQFDFAGISTRTVANGAAAQHF